MSNLFYGGNKLLDAKKILERVEIAEGMKVADLGCGGAGHFCVPAAHLVGNSGIVYAVDIQKIVIEGVRSRRKTEGIDNLKTIQANIENYKSTGIKDGFCDLVMLINILFQSHKYFDILKEAIRMLKNSGTLLIVDWNQSVIPFGPPLESRVKKSEINALLYKLASERIDEFDAGKYHFGMIFKK
ncbi:MAG: methyltransferase domain-containing protein [Patescibacteria group bacterium]|nr:methyltransferase domain-containing protein [Patescibacteria group bacterium]